MTGCWSIIFGSPIRFGSMAAQMRNFLDQTGSLWFEGKPIGKVGSVFTSTVSQHGGWDTGETGLIRTLFGLSILGQTSLLTARNVITIVPGTAST